MWKAFVVSSSRSVSRVDCLAMSFVDGGVLHRRCVSRCVPKLAFCQPAVVFKTSPWLRSALWPNG